MVFLTWHGTGSQQFPNIAHFLGIRCKLGHAESGR